MDFSLSLGCGIIFDFDGVIINSSVVQRVALQISHELIVGEGPEPSFEDFSQYSGDSLENIFAKMQLPSEMVESYRRISREMIEAIEVFDGMGALLNELVARDFALALCTGKDRARTLDLLEHLQLNRFFSAVVCSDDVENPKPHPESLLKAIKSIRCSPENVLMVGDAVNDIRCARGAGVRAIGVCWAEEASRDALEQESPDAICDTIPEFLDVVDGLCNETMSEYNGRKGLTLK